MTAASSSSTSPSSSSPSCASPSSGATTITPTTPTDWILTYKLSEPCDYEKLTNSSSIEFISCTVETSKGTKAERITGFHIKFFGESDEQKVRREADQQAKRLADIISFKSGMRVLYNYDGKSRKNRN